jgi:hypothetical protein
VAEALDSDGEPIWRVTVVFTVAPTKADGPKLASLGRHIGSALEELGEYRFPITRFVSKREASQLRLAAA